MHGTLQFIAHFHILSLDLHENSVGRKDREYNLAVSNWTSDGRHDVSRIMKPGLGPCFLSPKPALSPLQCVIPRSHFSWFRTRGSLDHAPSSVHNYHCRRHHPPTHHHHPPPHITIVISITMNLLLLIRRNLFQVSVTMISRVHEGKPWQLIASLSDSSYQHVRKSVLNHPFPCSLCGYPNPVPRWLKKMRVMSNEDHQYYRHQHASPICLFQWSTAANQTTPKLSGLKQQPCYLLMIL